MCNMFGDEFFSHVRRHVNTMFNNIFAHSLVYIHTIFEDIFRLFLKTCLHNVWRDIFLCLRHDYTMFENIFTQCLKTLYNFVLDLSTLCFMVFSHEDMFTQRHPVYGMFTKCLTHTYSKFIKLFFLLKIDKNSKWSWLKCFIIYHNFWNGSKCYRVFSYFSIV